MGFEIKDGVLERYGEEIGITDVVIPKGVTRIGEWAFGGCKDLTGITIPDSVTSIECYAFCGCESLTDIVIPKSVVGLGEYAFDGCSSLSSVTIEHPGCCAIEDASGDGQYGTKVPFNGTIYGYDDSTAQAYAEEHEYAFRA